MEWMILWVTRASCHIRKYKYHWLDFAINKFTLNYIWLSGGKSYSYRFEIYALHLRIYAFMHLHLQQFIRDIITVWHEQSLKNRNIQKLIHVAQMNPDKLVQLIATFRSHLIKQQQIQEWLYTVYNNKKHTMRLTTPRKTPWSTSIEEIMIFKWEDFRSHR